MKLLKLHSILIFAFGLHMSSSAEPVSLFNGKDLEGWFGDPKVWSVKDGAITGETTPENKITQNTYLIWQAGKVDNFELRLKYRNVNGNRGIQYRSRMRHAEGWGVLGYQADLEAGNTYSGILYEDGGRGVVAQRGQKVVARPDGKKDVVGSTGDPATIQAEIKKEDWNEYIIIARGNYFRHMINGHITMEFVDEQKEKRADSGILAFQVHAGPPMMVQYKDIQLTKLTGEDAKPLETAESLARWITQKPVIITDATQEGDAIKPNLPKAKKLPGPRPFWIWAHNKPKKGERVLLRKEFDSPDSAKALAVATCDNSFKIKINGKQALAGTNWAQSYRKDVRPLLRKGKNEILAEATNEGGPAGFLFKLILTKADGSQSFIVSDKSWEVFDPKKITPGSVVEEKGEVDEILGDDAEDPAITRAHVIGKLGSGPWGDPLNAPQQSSSGGSNPLRPLNLLPGFQVELLYTVPRNLQGSWVCMTFDDKGRIIASDQGGRGLSRLTPAPIGSNEMTRAESLDVKMTGSQGMLYAFGKLYVSCSAGPGPGFYIIEDTDADDTFDKVTKVRAIRGGGEHGPHSLVLSPDKKWIYFIAGNYTKLPEPLTGYLPPKNWQEDLLLPRQWDANGHARGLKAPGGWICRTDPEGKKWEVFCNGFRNPFDMAFNADGELFAYDADMEWDIGAPWYRPTRLVHAASGAEFGWRSGTGKWPAWYPDSLPPVLDIGPGSPTGVSSGRGTKFPAKYQRALFLNDWTFGTIYAVHLTPEGASYKGVKEEFVSGIPLPVTDSGIGPDGAFYFAIGGRSIQSALYRVTYVGKESTAPVDGRDTKFAKERELRKSLEAFHGKQDPKAVDAALSQLEHDDRHIRFAARIALEHQPVEQWQDKALSLKQPRALITAVIGLARQGKPGPEGGTSALQPRLLKTLSDLDFEHLNESLQIDWLRALALTFIRQGKPDDETAVAFGKRIAPLYPAKSDALNRELVQLLVYLNEPSVIDKTIALLHQKHEQSFDISDELLKRHGGYGGSIRRMLDNQPQIQNLHYAFVLRNLRYGWTLEQRKAYYDFLDTQSKASGGNSYGKFLVNIRKEAMGNTPEHVQVALKLKKGKLAALPAELPKPKGPGKEWKTADIEKLTAQGLSGRNFEHGRKMFAAAKCIQCHRFDGFGGATGPDLTGAAGRFSSRDLAEAMTEPSKVISDQYQATVFLTEDEEVITGRVIGDEEGKLVVMTDPFDASKTATIAEKEIKERKPSPVSLMPAGLMNTLNAEEVKDLLAYLMSRGNPQDRMFKQQQ